MTTHSPISALKRTWAPVLLLMVTAPFLAEVFGGAMPLLDFVQPAIFFPFVVFLYGLPLLVIRELSTRYGFGPLGIWVLGMTYGLFNEGLLSETLYAGLDHAVEAYASYGVIGDLRLPWLLYILPWHGALSVLFPITVVDRIFPGFAGRQWLPGKLTWGLAIGVPALAILRFVAWGEDRGVAGLGGFVLHLAFVLLVGAVVCWVAVRPARRPRYAVETEWSGLSWHFLAFGVAAYAVTNLGGVALTTLAVPWPMYAGYALLAVGIVGWWATRRSEVTRTEVLSLVFGGLAVQAVTGIVAGSIGGNLAWLAVAVVGLVAAAVWLVWLERGRRAVAKAVGR